MIESYDRLNARNLINIENQFNMGSCNCHRKRYTRSSWKTKKDSGGEKSKNQNPKKEGKLEMLKALWEKSKEDDSEESKE